MLNRLFHPPALHTAAHGSEKKVGWVELFYDLIYVATIIQLGNALSQHPGILGFLAFAGLFVPIWYTWTGFTFYSNRFVVDDVVHRGAVFLQMFAVGAMAVYVPRVLDGDYRAFTLAYAGARFVLVALYARAWWQVPEAREFTRLYTFGFAAGAVLWLASAFLPPPWTYWLWGAAMLLDLAVPLNRHARELTGRYPPDVLHMSERYGLLIIIVLGESFVKVLTSLADAGAPPEGMLLGTLTLLVTCCLWWIYFDDVAGSRIKSTPSAAFVWIYAHLPLTIAVTATGVAIKKAVFFPPMEVAPAKYRWLLCGTLALALLAVSVIDLVTERRQSEMSDRSRTQVRLACAALTVLLAPAGAGLPSWLFLTLVTAVCVGQVVFDLSMAPLMEHPDAAHEDAHQVFAKPSAAESALAAKRGTRRDISEAVRKGAPSHLRRDLYFHLMAGGWFRVFATLTVLFLISNLVFAVLYLLEPWSVENVRPDSFLDAFSFSVQTMATIGYGSMSPATPYAHTVVIIEAAFGVLAVALATGLMFAKASRPSSSILFTDVAVINTREGVPTLALRVGNARGNDIVEASLTVVAVIEEMTPEGHKGRMLYDLKLRRDTTPLFVLTWSVFHVIDEESPLHGIDPDGIEDRLSALVCTMTGYDATYAQTTHARKVYYAEDILYGRRFIDVVSSLDDGRMMVDYDHFHATRPEADAAAEDA